MRQRGVRIAVAVTRERRRPWIRACTHNTRRATRPLFAQKPTFYSAICMSALCQKQVPTNSIHRSGHGVGILSSRLIDAAPPLGPAEAGQRSMTDQELLISGKREVR